MNKTTALWKLSQDEVHWNRTLTLELLRKEAEALLGYAEETDRDNNNSDENLPSPKPGLEHSGN